MGAGIYHEGAPDGPWGRALAFWKAEVLSLPCPVLSCPSVLCHECAINCASPCACVGVFVGQDAADCWPTSGPPGYLQPPSP